MSFRPFCSPSLISSAIIVMPLVAYHPQRTQKVELRLVFTIELYVEHVCIEFVFKFRYASAIMSMASDHVVINELIEGTNNGL